MLLLLPAEEQKIYNPYNILFLFKKDTKTILENISLLQMCTMDILSF